MVVVVINIVVRITVARVPGPQCYVFGGRFAHSGFKKSKGAGFGVSSDASPMCPLFCRLVFGMAIRLPAFEVEMAGWGDLGNRHCHHWRYSFSPRMLKQQRLTFRT